MSKAFLHSRGKMISFSIDSMILPRIPFEDPDLFSRPPEHAAFAKQPGCGMMEQHKIPWSGAEKMSEITVSAVHLSTRHRMDQE